MQGGRYGPTACKEEYVPTETTGSQPLTPLDTQFSSVAEEKRCEYCHGNGATRPCQVNRWLSRIRSPTPPLLPSSPVLVFYQYSVVQIWSIPKHCHDSILSSWSLSTLIVYHHVSDVWPYTSSLYEGDALESLVLHLTINVYSHQSHLSVSKQVYLSQTQISFDHLLSLPSNVLAQTETRPGSYTPIWVKMNLSIGGSRQSKEIRRSFVGMELETIQIPGTILIKWPTIPLDSRRLRAEDAERSLIIQTTPQWNQLDEKALERREMPESRRQSSKTAKYTTAYE